MFKQGEALTLNRKEWDTSERSRSSGKSEDIRLLGTSIQMSLFHVSVTFLPNQGPGLGIADFLGLDFNFL